MTEAILWTGGRIFTGERYVESLLVEDGRVAFAGPLPDARRRAPTGVEREELSGRLAIPGLVDAHLHLAEIARARDALDLSRARSIEEIRTLVARWADGHASGPIVGRDWQTDRLREGRPPTARDLDSAAPERPVVLYHASGHAAALSTAALGASGLDRDRTGFRDGTVGRAADGSPNGLLYEGALRALARWVDEALPLSAERLEATLDSLPSVGLTRVGTVSTGPDESQALRDLACSGRMAISVRAYVRLFQLGEYPDPLLAARTDRFSIVGTKAFIDGAFGPRTAWLSEPYADDPSTSGIAVGDEADLAAKIELAAARGLAPALHAIGDRGVERASRLLAPWTGRPGPPARIEHAALTPPGTLGLLDRIRPTLVVQPEFVWNDWWLAARLGAARARWAYLFRSLVDRGHRLAGSSDAPYGPVDPFRGLRAAVSRRDALGRSANPDPGEALGSEEALALYTRGAAEALGDLSEGRLEAGCAADLVVVGASRLSEAIRSDGVPVRETWIAGRKVHPAPPGETV